MPDGNPFPLITSFPLAVVSIILYGTLAFTSGYYYKQFYVLKLNQQLTRFDYPKLIFFAVLTISALCDIPIYIACAALNGPVDCEWETVTYPLFWSLHLFAVCGYAYCIVTPSILWSDIVNKKDGRLWFSNHPIDCTKLYFRILISIYVLVELSTVLCIILFFQVNNKDSFTTDSIFNAMNVCIEPILLFFITGGCLLCGIRLQSYVRNVKLDSSKELSFLIHLNVIMSIIFVSYLARALLVLQLFHGMPEDYRSSLDVSYFTWLLCTRWGPHVFCSFCLISTMRYSGVEVATRKQKQWTKTITIVNPSSNRSSLTGFSNAMNYVRLGKLLGESSSGSKDARKVDELKQLLLDGKHAQSATIGSIGSKDLDPDDEEGMEQSSHQESMDYAERQRESMQALNKRWLSCDDRNESFDDLRGVRYSQTSSQRSSAQTVNSVYQQYYLHLANKESANFDDSFATRNSHSESSSIYPITLGHETPRSQFSSSPIPTFITMKNDNGEARRSHPTHSSPHPSHPPRSSFISASNYMIDVDFMNETDTSRSDSHSQSQSSRSENHSNSQSPCGSFVPNRSLV